MRNEIRNHLTFTQEELKSAFEKVQAQDWKDPICKIVPMENLDCIRQAVIHYTGTVPTFAHMGGNRVAVEATGYRMGPCGDR